MTDLQSTHNRTMHKFPRNPVRSKSACLDAVLTVATLSSRHRPWPACIRTARAVHLAPKELGGSDGAKVLRIHADAIRARGINALIPPRRHPRGYLVREPTRIHPASGPQDAEQREAIRVGASCPVPARPKLGLVHRHWSALVDELPEARYRFFIHRNQSFRLGHVPGHVAVTRGHLFCSREADLLQ